MALQKRTLLMLGRLAALGAAAALKGRKRRMAFMAHDLLWLYPTLRRNCGWHGETVTGFRTENREVWLTIDDGPNARDTPDILDVLDRHEARATFFAVGKRVDQERALCREILRRGHSLGNHTYSHPSALWWAWPRPLVRQEVERGNRALEVATGKRPIYFRSPVGMSNFSVHPAAAAHGLRVIGWSASGTDGCPGVPSEIARRIMKQVRPGGIVLLHEGGNSRHRALTLARVLEQLGEEGYRCILPEESSLL